MKTSMKPFISKAGKGLAKILLIGSVSAPLPVPTGYAAVQQQLKIGDSYGGGKIAYIFNRGERGFVEGETHGIIAARRDLGVSDTWSKAIARCKAYQANGYRNWHLPSKDELDKLYANRRSIGGFKEHHYYWSSTESDSNDAWDQSFRDGSRNLAYKLDADYIRPVRTF
jgi:hypothetical protein